MVRATTNSLENIQFGGLTGALNMCTLAVSFTECTAVNPANELRGRALAWHT